MRVHLRRLRWTSLAVFTAATLIPAPGSAYTEPHASLWCGWSNSYCTEVHDAGQVFGGYVGHDEPSTLFYSNEPGSGSRMRYDLTLPKDPPPGKPLTRSYSFQLHPAFWFGMAVCDDQSYPNPDRKPCTPASDNNIKSFKDHPGTAFMEMQFYPPGWVAWPSGNSCDATKWCAALNIDSLSEDPINGTTLNQTCANAIGGLEYVNFAFMTKTGKAHAPANPFDATIDTYTPNKATDLFMNSGDHLGVTLQDTPKGLQIVISDQTTHQTGSMTASADNGFAMIKYAPAPSTKCKPIPYNFHPMYSTSSEQTRVPWAAHSYNIAFADEIGHWDYCNGSVSTAFPFQCTGTEGKKANIEPSDGDDAFCFNAADSTLVSLSGCLGTNTGFDGVPYTKVWPDGNPNHAESFLFTSPLTGKDFNRNYPRSAFEADLPRIEAADFGGSCDRSTGVGCTLLPVTDDSRPVSFYPFFSIGERNDNCVWALGNDIAGFTQNDFGKNSQYGSLLFSNYLVFGGGGTEFMRTNNFRQIVTNPCRNQGEQN